MSYDPQSPDAMFSRIMARLEDQDRTALVARVDMIQRLDRIEVQALKTNGRVNCLELWQTDVKARIAIIALLVSGAGTIIALMIEKIWRS